MILRSESTRKLVTNKISHAQPSTFRPFASESSSIRNNRKLFLDRSCPTGYQNPLPVLHIPDLSAQGKGVDLDVYLCTEGSCSIRDQVHLLYDHFFFTPVRSSRSFPLSIMNLPSRGMRQPTKTTPPSFVIRFGLGTNVDDRRTRLRAPFA